MPFQPQAVTLDTVKRMSQRVRRVAQAKYPDMDLAQHQALELVAAALGFEDWHTAQQALSNPKEEPSPVSSAAASSAQPKLLVDRAGSMLLIPLAEQKAGDVVWVHGPLTSNEQFKPLEGLSFQLMAKEEGWDLSPEDGHHFVAWRMPRQEGFREGNKPSVLLVIDEGLLLNVERLGVIREQITRRYDIDKTWSTSPTALLNLRHRLSPVKQKLMSVPTAFDFEEEAERLLRSLGHKGAPIFKSKQSEKAHERRLQPVLFRVAQALTVLRSELLKRSTPKQWADFEKDCHHALSSDCKDELTRTDLRARLVCQVYLVVKTCGFLSGMDWWENMSKSQRRAFKKSIVAAMSEENLATAKPLDKNYFARMRRRIMKRAKEQAAAKGGG